MKYVKKQLKKNWFRAIAVAMLFLMSSVFVFNYTDAYVRVKGYFRKDGTYVSPHVRSNPNGLKYDNYSYTPGQDLYNKTYGKRGSDWDTPAWITDPNYYEGKSLYESGSIGGYNPTNTISNKWCPSPMLGAQRCYLWEITPTKHHTPPTFSKRVYKTINSPTVWELSHWSSFGWGTRKPFNNPQAFLRKGYKWSDIKIITQTELEKYQWVSRTEMYF